MDSYNNKEDITGALLEPLFSGKNMCLKYIGGVGHFS